jgi:hypothetical protein
VVPAGPLPIGILALSFQTRKIGKRREVLSRSIYPSAVLPQESTGRARRLRRKPSVHTGTLAKGDSGCFPIERIDLLGSGVARGDQGIVRADRKPGGPDITQVRNPFRFPITYPHSPNLGTVLESKE